jgi:uncharacterized UBP type Zn finger protein
MKIIALTESVNKINHLMKTLPNGLIIDISRLDYKTYLEDMNSELNIWIRENNLSVIDLRVNGFKDFNKLVTED